MITTQFVTIGLLLFIATTTMIMLQMKKFHPASFSILVVSTAVAGIMLMPQA